MGCAYFVEYPGHYKEDGDDWLMFDTLQEALSEFLRANMEEESATLTWSS